MINRQGRQPCAVELCHGVGGGGGGRERRRTVTVVLIVVEKEEEGSKGELLHTKVLLVGVGGGGRGETEGGELLL